MSFPREPNGLAKFCAIRYASAAAARSPVTTVGAAALSAPIARMPCGLPWLDVMTGGGFVRGSVVMVHGEPGAGKSTALLQACNGIAGSLYVSSEEAAGMVAARAKRLGIRSSQQLLAIEDIGIALDAAAGSRLVIIDSIQTMEPGNPITRTKSIVDHARRFNSCVIIVCHENKAGGHHGPRTLEHLIDVSIKIGRGPPRTIIVDKNRFGPADLMLGLKMTETGFVSCPL